MQSQTSLRYNLSPKLSILLGCVVLLRASSWLPRHQHNNMTWQWWKLGKQHQRPHPQSTMRLPIVRVWLHLTLLPVHHIVPIVWAKSSTRQPFIFLPTSTRRSFCTLNCPRQESSEQSLPQQSSIHLWLCSSRDARIAALLNGQCCLICADCRSEQVRLESVALCNSLLRQYEKPSLDNSVSERWVPVQLLNEAQS